MDGAPMVCDKDGFCRGWLKGLVSHPCRKERGVDGARRDRGRERCPRGLKPVPFKALSLLGRGACFPILRAMRLRVGWGTHGLWLGWRFLVWVLTDGWVEAL